MNMEDGESGAWSVNLLFYTLTQKESGRALTFHYSNIKGGLNTYIHAENHEYIVHCFFQCALK